MSDLSPVSHDPARSLLDQMVTFIDSVNLSDAKHELAKLTAIKAWAIAQLGIDYEVGDRVVITEEIPTDNGWRPYRESLAIGQTGVVTDIDFSRHSWYACVALESAWSVTETHGEVKRYWKGRAEDTPEGFEPPSKYEQKRYPDGKRKVFMLDVCWVRCAPVECPVHGVVEWCGQAQLKDCPNLAACERHGREWALAPLTWDEAEQT